jgi:hypothetical protein
MKSLLVPGIQWLQLQLAAASAEAGDVEADQPPGMFYCYFTEMRGSSASTRDLTILCIETPMHCKVDFLGVIVWFLAPYGGIMCVSRQFAADSSSLVPDLLFFAFPRFLFPIRKSNFSVLHHPTASNRYNRHRICASFTS